MPRLWPFAVALVFVLIAGCSATRVETEHFGSSAAIERAMKLHYERNASEGNCYNPIVDGFTRLDVREDTPDRLVVHARYFWRDRFQDAGGDGGSGRGGCSGFGERTFALTREGSDLVVTMDGPQEEPALRTLIRQLFSS